ncbi:hypothetical protein FNAPI_111 [Fusarium napiforme]|uniref:Uncharacterized protein n=1 Tax=Fusarium napiforme TaxID=42672 RepID=A0A8H5NJ79_9HYPO|nr:hypothetical protein FNAPI_111 [Fusarium napiforme]
MAIDFSYSFWPTLEVIWDVSPHFSLESRYLYPTRKQPSFIRENQEQIGHLRGERYRVHHFLSRKSSGEEEKTDLLSSHVPKRTKEKLILSPKVTKEYVEVGLIVGDVPEKHLSDGTKARRDSRVYPFRVSDDSAAIEETITGDYHDLLKDSKSKKQGNEVCITRDADAILDDKDLTTDVETHYRDQDISGDVGIPISDRVAAIPNRGHSAHQYPARKMTLEFAVATDNARVLPECKSMSKPYAKASVCMDLLLPIRLVSRSFHTTIDDIFPCAGNVVSIEDSGGYGVDERWTSRILFDPKRDIMRISNNWVPRLKRHGEVGAPSRSPVRHLMLAPLHSPPGSAPRNSGRHPNPDDLPRGRVLRRDEEDGISLPRRMMYSDCTCAAYNVTALHWAVSTSYGNTVGILTDTSSLQIAQYEVVTINSHHRTAEQARIIHNFNDPEGKSHIFIANTRIFNSSVNLDTSRVSVRAETRPTMKIPMATPTVPTSHTTLPTERS